MIFEIMWGIIEIIQFIHSDKHMDGAGDRFWIKSNYGTFISFQKKSCGPKNFQITCRGWKMSFWQFFRMGPDGRALLVQPSKINRGNRKILFVFYSYEYLERLEGKIRDGICFVLINQIITMCHNTLLFNFSSVPYARSAR